MVSTDASGAFGGAMGKRLLLVGKCSVFACIVSTSHCAAASTARVIQTIPLCPGLTVVTAVSQSNGDYESIKTIEGDDATEVTLKYSNEHTETDFLGDGMPHLVKSLLHRHVLKNDLKSANLYEQQFYPKMPDRVPGTTAIGTSSDVLMELKRSGEADIAIFIEMTGEVSGSRDDHPNVFDFQVLGHVKRVEVSDVMMPVIVNDVPSQLPAIHVAGDFSGDQSEFYFLDDRANPLTLRYRYGVGAMPSGDIASVMAAMDDKAPKRADLDHFDVTKIAFRCAAAAPTPAAPSQSAAAQPVPIKPVPLSPSSVEQQLATTGKAEIYDIYFSFDSADIRPESEPSIKEIADVMNKHPDWKLSVAGHTDNIGGDAFNQSLSERRAASVKVALMTRYHINAGRLSTTGFGDKRPQDTNATLEGRARNRRVELSRV
jgi:outer membrane protein OmpA-like peptidoglycan-associated protein